jgi:hypothetical protein
MTLFNGKLYRVVGQQTLAVSNSAVGPTLAGAKVEAMVVQVNDASIRWTAEGTTPTASVGYSEKVNNVFLLDDRLELDNFSAIRKTSTDAEIDFLFLAGVP